MNFLATTSRRPAALSGSGPLTSASPQGFSNLAQAPSATKEPPHGAQNPFRSGRPRGRHCHGPDYRPRLPARHQGRHRRPLRVELRLGGPRVHQHPGPRRLRVRAGLAARGAHTGLPVVDLVPARVVQDRGPARRPDHLQEHDLDLSRGRGEGRGGHRRQPHDRGQRHRHRRHAVHQVQLPRRVLGLRLPHVPDVDRQLPGPLERPELRTRGPGRPGHRRGARPRDHRRVPERPALARRRRLPDRRGQAHRGRRPGEHQEPADQPQRLLEAGGHLRRGRGRPAHRVHGQRGRPGVPLRLRPQARLQQREARLPEQLRRGLGLSARQRGRRLRGQPRHRAQRRHPELQGRRQLHPGQRLHAGLALRCARHQLRLRVERRGRRTARQRPGQRLLAGRLEVPARLAGDQVHGRLPQRHPRPGGRQLVGRRQQPDRLRPRQQGLCGDQPRGHDGQPLVPDLAARRHLLQRAEQHHGDGQLHRLVHRVGGPEHRAGDLRRQVLLLNRHPARTAPPWRCGPGAPEIPCRCFHDSCCNPFAGGTVARAPGIEAEPRRGVGPELSRRRKEFHL
ncbi:hypothetical protein SGPA1_31071 [Streptomyces misionensis JCM 4497]